MNDPESPSPAPNDSPNDLPQQVAALQRLVTTLLVALLVVTGTLVVYLFYQSHILGKEIQAIKPQATPVIQAFTRTRPAMEKFVQDLTQYGRTHPDFQPILRRYGIVATSAVPARVVKPIPRALPKKPASK